MSKRLFFHTEFHPKDLSRKQIREIYNSTCSDILNKELQIEQFTTAYHRPKNLGDAVTSSKLFQPEELTASSILRDIIYTEIIGRDANNNNA